MYKYYFHIQNEQIISKGQTKMLGDVLNIEVPKDVYDNSEQYIYQNGEVVIDPDYESKQAAKEAEKIAKLNLTGADVERGIYQAKGIDFDDIIAMVTQLQPDGLDIKALKIELKANHFYRGNPYVNAVGTLLGFTSEQLDKFFEYNDYTYLITDSETPSDEVEGGVVE